jgi:membrane protease YdiL (CAAX protease family)
VFSVSFSLVLDYLLSLLARAEKLHSLFEQYGQVVNLISGENFLLVLLFVGILIPIFEEVLFRGLIFGELKKAMRVSIAVLLQAFLFGLSHMNLIQGIYAFVLGLILGAVYEKSRNLLLPMVVHISFNAFSVLMSGIVSPESLQKWQTVLNMAGFLLFFVSGAVLIWSMRKSEGGNRNECNKGSGSPQLHPGVSEGSD